jgi:acetyl esterase/lipase
MDIEGNPFDNSTAHSYIPQARQTYETAYNWVVNTYNICKDGVFLGGRSLGGGMCFDLLQSSIPVIAACPLVPACNQMWYWSYMTAARKKFIFDKLGLTEAQPTWTSNKTLSEEEFQYIYENFEILMDCAPFWRGIEDLPEKDILFSIGRISANSKFDETEYNIYSKLSFKVKAPVKLFGCPEDNVVPSGRNAELMYLMLKNAGQDCELALYNSKISAPHHFELQDPQYMTQVTTKDGQTMQVPLIYTEMLEYWKKYETCR